jgi:hypothetical protein
MGLCSCAWVPPRGVRQRPGRVSSRTRSPYSSSYHVYRWSDAAYRGDWEALFRIAVRGSWDFAYGRFANCTRLLRNPQGARTPSRYTALHQAAWHGAPVNIVQGLIELGASRGYSVMFFHSTQGLTSYATYRWSPNHRRQTPTTARYCA